MTRTWAHGGVMADAAAFNKKVKLVWLSLGTAESERFQTGVRGYRDALEKAGIKTAFYESPGPAHEWQTWRRSLKEFAPLLFKLAEANTNQTKKFFDVFNEKVIRRPSRSPRSARTEQMPAARH